MRALMVAPTPFFSDRGCHVRILEEIKALKRHGVDILLTTYHLGKDINGIDIRRIINIPWYKKLEAGPSLHKLYIDLLLLLKTGHVFIKEVPTVIHCFLHEGAFISEVLKGFRHTPVIFDLQGSLVDELVSHRFIRSGNIFYYIFKILEKYIDRRADRIIVPTNLLKYLLINEFKIPCEKIDIIPDGVDIKFFLPLEDKVGVRRSLGLPIDKKVVVYLGLLTGYQGLDLLLEVIKAIKRIRTDVYFLVMGYPNVELYMKKADLLGISDITRFTGRISYQQAPIYVGIGDVAVSLKLSKSEANGKLLNYMAVGIPVVCFDTPVNIEILGDLGIYAEYGSIDSVVDRLIFLLDNEDKSYELGVKLRKRAVEMFSYEQIGREIMRVYEKIFQNR